MSFYKFDKYDQPNFCLFKIKTGSNSYFNQIIFSSDNLKHLLKWLNVFVDKAEITCSTHVIFMAKIGLIESKSDH